MDGCDSDVREGDQEAPQQQAAADNASRDTVEPTAARTARDASPETEAAARPETDTGPSKQPSKAVRHLLCVLC